MPVDVQTRIPDDLLLAAKNEVFDGWTGVDASTQYEREQVRQHLGPKYAHVPLDDIHAQMVNLRKRENTKRAAVERKKSHEMSAEYIAYLQTDHWLEFAERVRKFWGHRCAICYKPRARDVHHRTRERLWREILTDCILLCRPCHDHMENLIREDAKQPRLPI